VLVVTQKSLVPLQAHARGYWTVEESKNVRKFFDEFAKSRNFDPLQPQNWYRFSSDDILQVKVRNPKKNYKYEKKETYKYLEWKLGFVSLQGVNC
jgi:hypothetical protein